MNQLRIFLMSFYRNAEITFRKSHIVAAVPDQNALLCHRLVQPRPRPKKNIIGLRVIDGKAHMLKPCFQIIPLAGQHGLAPADILRLIQRRHACVLSRNRHIPWLAHLSHTGKQLRIGRKPVAQPQPGHGVNLGKGFQNKQSGKPVYIFLHGILLRRIQKFIKALVHHQQRTAGGALLQNP